MMDRYDRIDGDQTYEEVRPIQFKEQKADIKLIVSGAIMLVYINDVALSSRCYGATGGGIGVFVECGSVTWENVQLKIPDCI